MQRHCPAVLEVLRTGGDKALAVVDSEVWRRASSSKNGKGPFGKAYVPQGAAGNATRNPSCTSGRNKAVDAAVAEACETGLAQAVWETQAHFNPCSATATFNAIQPGFHDAHCLPGTLYSSYVINDGGLAVHTHAHDVGGSCDAMVVTSRGVADDAANGGCLWLPDVGATGLRVLTAQDVGVTFLEGKAVRHGVVACQTGGEVRRVSVPFYTRRPAVLAGFCHIPDCTCPSINITFDALRAMSKAERKSTVLAHRNSCL